MLMCPLAVTDTVGRACCRSPVYLNLVCRESRVVCEWFVKSFRLQVKTGERGRLASFDGVYVCRPRSASSVDSAAEKVTANLESRHSLSCQPIVYRRMTLRGPS